jgi:hypothetical protein
MARGGNRPGAGRKPGAPNKATAERQQAVAASGVTPLEYMLSVMRDETISADRRDDIAKAAAPYVHPKLASVEHKGDPDNPLIPEVAVSDRDLAKAVAFLLSQGLRADGGS